MISFSLTASATSRCADWRRDRHLPGDLVLRSACNVYRASRARAASSSLKLSVSDPRGTPPSLHSFEHRKHKRAALAIARRRGGGEGLRQACFFFPPYRRRRLAVGAPLANRVRSGRKHALTRTDGLLVQPPTSLASSLKNRPAPLEAPAPMREETSHELRRCLALSRSCTQIPTATVR